MIKVHSLTSILLLTLASHVCAVTFIGPDQGSWGVGTNWDTGFAPEVVFGENAVISNGSTVLYDGTALGDLKIDLGGSLTITNGSTWNQSVGTNWTQVNNGTLTLDKGTLRRSLSGNLVGSQIAGFAGAPTTSVINAKNGSLIDVGGNFILSYTNYTTSTFNLTDSTVVAAGELWLGSNTANDNNQIVTLNISNSTITTRGTVGLWVWDYAAAGSNMRINFSGPAGSYIEVADSIGTRPDATGANNQATWQSLWDVGVLTAFGVSGLTGAVFDDYFATTGTSFREGAIVGEALIPYRLTLQVPEPSAALLLLGSAAGLLGVRRRR